MGVKGTNKKKHSPCGKVEIMKFSVNGKLFDLNVIASRCGAPAQDEENYMARLFIDVKDAETAYDEDREAWIVDAAEWAWIVDAAKQYAEAQTEDSVDGWSYEAVAIEVKA